MSFFTHTIPRYAPPPVFALVFALAALLPAPSALASETPAESIVAEVAAVEVAAVEVAAVEVAAVEVTPLAVPADVAAVEVTPLAIPAEITLSTVPPPDVPTLISTTALRWNLSPDRLLRIAWCESRFDPTAISYAGHLGLFQFAHPTWHVASHAVGLPNASPFDPAANTEAAAWLMSTDGFHHWGCR